ncbi:hypothetical protein K4K59_010343 [Colletotrichum sp. SAR11_240]|nr:hypothetical protein K4K59_010343 [Colletotrichum sp. SAR11_240]
MDTQTSSSSTDTVTDMNDNTPNSGRVMTNRRANNTDPYEVIGFGQCGWVYHRKGRNHVVKLARQGYQDALQTDHTAHLKVRAAFDSHKPPVNVPEPILLAPPTSRWWKKHSSILLEAPHDISQKTMCALLSQRIPPLPKSHRDKLIDTFCPAHKRRDAAADPKNEDALARVYLGRRRVPGAPLPPNFSLRNYNLTLDQLLQLDAPVEDYARQMGEALCVMHWGAWVDGYGIEFVLGGQPKPPKMASSTTAGKQTAASVDINSAASPAQPAYDANLAQLWVLDFDLCSMWDRERMCRFPNDLVQQLVRAFFKNDPYYPLPSMKGAALTARLIANGTFVIAVARRKDRLQTLLDAHGPDKVAAEPYDMTDLEGMPEWVNKLSIQRSIDFTSPTSISLPNITSELTTNYLAPLHLITHFLPHLQSLKTTQPAAAAHIVLVSSGLALVPIPRCPNYCATKSALHSLAWTLRTQLAAHDASSHVRVIEVVPPAVQTELHSIQPDLVAAGQANFGMPLEEFTEETWTALEEGKEDEIIVGPAKNFAHVETDRKKMFDRMAEMFRSGSKI